jgi:hypothetical protein
MGTQNKRRPILTMGGWLAAGGFGGSGWYLLERHGATALPHFVLPPDVTLCAGIVAVAAGAVTFIVQVLGWLLRLSQQRQAGRRLLEVTKTYEEAEKTYRLMTGKSSGSRGGPEDQGDGDPDPGSDSGQGAG